MTEYTIVIEDAGTNFAAYVVGLDGIITTGQTIDEVIEKCVRRFPFISRVCDSVEMN